MSALSIVNIKCPHCGNDVTLQLHSSVNLVFDKELIDPLLNGDLFKHKCPCCSEEIEYKHNILVNDMYYNPARFVWFDAEGNIDEFIEEQQKRSDDFMSKISSGVKHITSAKLTYVFETFEEFKMAVECCLEGKVIDASKIHTLASLPTGMKVLSFSDIDSEK